MKSALQTWLTTYPADRAAKPPVKLGRASYQAVMQDVPAALRPLIPFHDRFEIVGSTGSGPWTDISWVAVLDRAISATAQEGFYPTYLLSADGERLVLSIQQGSGLLSKRVGKRATIAELKRRAALMRTRASGNLGRLNTDPIELGTRRSHRRGPLYEAGHVLGRTYQANALPSDEELIDDFKAIVRAHIAIAKDGGASSLESIVETAKADGLGEADLSYVKRYNLHRVAERNASHSKAVKAHYPDICMGCDTDMKAVYGATGAAMLDAHHLTSIGSLAENEMARFTVEDFAVLCPNCHRIIHRLVDSSDLKALQAIVRREWAE